MIKFMTKYTTSVVLLIPGRLARTYIKVVFKEHPSSIVLKEAVLLKKSFRPRASLRRLGYRRLWDGNTMIMLFTLVMLILGLARGRGLV